MDTLTGVSPSIPKPASTDAISGRHCIGTRCNSHISALHVQLFKSNRPVLDAVARSVTKDPQRRFRKNASVVPSRSRPEARAEETAGTFFLRPTGLFGGKKRCSGRPPTPLGGWFPPRAAPGKAPLGPETCPPRNRGGRPP